MEKGVYYNIAGERVLELNESHQYYCSPFSNGYAIMWLAGADSKVYMTVIDKSGRKMFDPNPGIEGTCISPDGKYMTTYVHGKVSIYDVKRNPVMEISYRICFLGMQSQFLNTWKKNYGRKMIAHFFISC